MTIMGLLDCKGPSVLEGYAELETREASLGLSPGLAGFDCSLLAYSSSLWSSVELNDKKQWGAHRLPGGKILHLDTSHREDIFPSLFFILGNKGAVAQSLNALLPPCIYSVGMAVKDHHHFSPPARHLAVIG